MTENGKYLSTGRLNDRQPLNVGLGLGLDCGQGSERQGPV